MIAHLLASSIVSIVGQPVIDAGDLSFMTGIWRGTLGGFTIEEIWLEPKAGNLTGVFRIASDETVSVVEIVTINEEGDSDLIYRLRHFDTKLTPWESEIDGPIEARAVLRGANHVRFMGLDPEGDVRWFDYRFEGDTLTTTIAFNGTPNGEERESFTLRYERVDKQ